MTIEDLVKRAGCPVCGKTEVIHDPDKHEDMPADEGGRTIEVECVDEKCHAVGHVTWNESRNKPLYCCWPGF